MKTMKVFHRERFALYGINFKKPGAPAGMFAGLVAGSRQQADEILVNLKIFKIPYRSHHQHFHGV